MPGCAAILRGRPPSAPLTLGLSKGRPFLHATSPFGLHTPCATLTLHPAAPLPRWDRLQPVSRHTRAPYQPHTLLSPLALSLSKGQLTSRRLSPPKPERSSVNPFPIR